MNELKEKFVKILKTLFGIVSSVLLTLLLCSGVFSDILKFFLWLFKLQYAQPETSIAGGIFIRILTFIVAYSLVWIISDAFGLFDKKFMKILYFILSTLVGFALAYIVWRLETHIIIIGIILGVVSFLAVSFIVISVVINRRRKTKPQEDC